jgi:hypothetical protein
MNDKREKADGSFEWEMEPGEYLRHLLHVF